MKKKVNLPLLFIHTMKVLKDKKGTEPFHFITEKLEGFYDNKDYLGAKKFIELFLTDRYLRSILVISKAFKNDDYLGDTLKKVELLLSKKVGEIY